MRFLWSFHLSSALHCCTVTLHPSHLLFIFFPLCLKMTVHPSCAAAPTASLARLSSVWHKSTLTTKERRSRSSVIIQSALRSVWHNLKEPQIKIWLKDTNQTILAALSKKDSQNNHQGHHLIWRQGCSRSEAVSAPSCKERRLMAVIRAAWSGELTGLLGRAAATKSKKAQRETSCFSDNDVWNVCYNTTNELHEKHPT